MTVSLWYQLKYFDTRILFVFDSAHYLLTASQLFPVLQKLTCCDFAAVFDAIKAPDFSSNIMLDGPIVPLLGALAFFVTGQPPAATSWLVMAVVLSLTNGFSAGTLAVLSNRLFPSKLFCLAIGVSFVISPATIVSSGRFLTEPIATFLLVVLCLICLHGVTTQSRVIRLFCAAAAGILAAVGFLTKVALAPGWCALVVIGLFCQKRSKSSIVRELLATLCGGVLVMLCWLVFTLASTGHFNLMPQRMPAYNLAFGNNIRLDGRATMPVSVSTLRYIEKGSSVSILLSVWSEHPAELANLYLRKIPRVMGYVWNDFKQVVFGLGINGQNYIHGAVLTLAAIGLFFMIVELTSSSESIDFGRQFLLLVTVVLMVIHLVIYLPFEAIARYAAPVQPFLLLAAAFGSVRVWTFGQKQALAVVPLIVLLLLLLKLDPSSTLLIQLPLGYALALLAFLRLLLVCSLFGYLIWLTFCRANSFGSHPRVVGILASLFLVFVVSPVIATTLFQDDQRECKLELNAGERLFRDILAPENSSQPKGETKSDFYSFYIDCDSRCSDSQFFVNGVKVDNNALSVNKIDSSRYFLFNIMRMNASVSDIPTEQMRQWRVVEIPAELLHLEQGQKNQLMVVAGSTGLTVYADRLNKNEKSIRLPDRSFFCASRFSNDATSLESRIISSDSTAIREHDTKFVNSGGLSLPLSVRQPRLYLLRAQMAQQAFDRAGERQCFRVKFTDKQFDRVLGASGALASGAGDVLKIDRYTLKLAHSMGATISLPQEFAHSRQAEICLNGKICSTGRANKAGVFITLHGGKPESVPQILAASPPFVLCKKDWTDFEICDNVFLPKYIDDKVLVTVSVFPGRWEQFSQYGPDRSVGSFLVKDLILSVKSLPSTDLANSRIEIF